MGRTGCVTHLSTDLDKLQRGLNRLPMTDAKINLLDCTDVCRPNAHTGGRRADALACPAKFVSNHAPQNCLQRFLLLAHEAA